MKMIKVDIEELEQMLEAAMQEACEAREKAQAAISKINHIKQTWLTKQELKQGKI